VRGGRREQGGQGKQGRQGEQGKEEKPINSNGLKPLDKFRDKP